MKVLLASEIEVKAIIKKIELKDVFYSIGR